MSHTFDSRDQATSRHNILALASAAKLPTDGQNTSLASLFGGAPKPPPLHKVGTGPTEDEVQANEKLEREMALTRGKWAAASGDDDKPRVSLASLLSARSATDSPISQRVTNKWPSNTALNDLPTKSTSAPTPVSSSLNRDVIPDRTSFTISPTPSFSHQPTLETRSSTTTTMSNPPYFSSTTSSSPPPQPSSGSTTPLSLAAALGSRATGPRLNQPTTNPAVHDDDGDQGPEHARPTSSLGRDGRGVVGGTGAVAMPGMVVPRSASGLSLSTGGVVEATIISRSPPLPQEQKLEEDHMEKEKEGDPTRGRPSSPTKTSSVLTDEPASFAVAENDSNSTTKEKELFSAPTASIGRIQSSNIVAERRKWSQALEDKAAPSAPAPSDSPTKVGKRGSVYERWQQQQHQDPAKTDSKPSAAELEVEKEARSLTGIRGGEFDKAASRLPVGGSAPLVHLNRDRPRPQKTTPRSIPSAQAAFNSLQAPALPVPSETRSRDSSATKSDPSPKFDSPALDDLTSTCGVVATSPEPSTKGLPDPTRGWSGPPIGVKEVPRYKSSSAEEDVIPVVKHGRGVALPGMSAAPPASEPAAPSSPTKPTWSSSFPPPTPSTPPPRARPVSVTVTKLASDNNTEAPRSPGGSVRDAIASWGSSQRSIPASSLALKESYGVKVPEQQPVDPTPGSPAKPTKSQSRMQSVDLSALKTTYSQPPPSQAPAEEAGSKPKLAQQHLTPTSSPSLNSTLPTPARAIPPTQTSTVATKPRSTKPVELLDLVTRPSPSTRSPGVLFSKDVLAAIDRRGGVTNIWVWVGSDVHVGVEQAVSSVEEQEGVRATVVRQGHEDEKLLELLGSPLVIRKGLMHSYSEQDERLYRAEMIGRSPLVEERPFVGSDHSPDFPVSYDLSFFGFGYCSQNQAPSSLCSGFSFVAASLGDVYVWKGKNSSRAEQDLAAGFAKIIAAGRPCSDVAEGSEPDHFWHALGGRSGELRYASSHLWRFHSAVRPTIYVSLVGNSGATPASSLSPSSIAVITSAFEHWILVPATLKENRSQIDSAIRFSRENASKWKTIGLQYRPPQHILFFPTTVPLDLRHLSRSLDFSILVSSAFSPPIPIPGASLIRALHLTEWRRATENTQCLFKCFCSKAVDLPPGCLYSLNH
ncbi:hypothetical protein T439DRAFT_336186 [Meredithblackwellia eburnea MCA 4105]